MLEQLQSSNSNACIRKFESPKGVFRVHSSATKPEIAGAIEEMFSERGLTVTKVNTNNRKGKATRRRGKGRPGRKSGMKIAVVTLQPGDSFYDV